jgi:putative ABC transport system permease protein
MINEAAMKKFGWTKNPLANKFRSWSAREDDGDRLTMIGVVKDFNFGVSYHSVNPMIIFLNNDGDGRTAYVRLHPDHTMDGMAAVRKLWEEIFPGHQPEITFLDQSLNSLYEKEEKFLNLLTAFSGIILLIASLGIIGLISFTTVLKKKEIAIRKVLGSSAQSIMRLLSKRFVGLLLLANVMAIPATYYVINLWLMNFTYRIDFHMWPFAIALVISVFFTAVSLLYHTALAAMENPVDALKSE